jgi:hypothetical protein
LAGFEVSLIGRFWVSPEEPATLTVDVQHAKASVSPTLYGLMTEEINYSYDGGLYAELIRNRTFRSDWSGVLNWYVVEKGAASAKLSVDDKTGPSAALNDAAAFNKKSEGVVPRYRSGRGTGHEEFLRRAYPGVRSQRLLRIASHRPRMVEMAQMPVGFCSALFR